MRCVHVKMLLSLFILGLFFPSLLSSPLLSSPLLFSPLSPLLSFLSSPLLSSSSPLLSSPLISSPLRPARCTSHHTPLKETKAPSLSWSWEELSVPSALFDDSISNDTLILTPHCLFFPYDEIQLERRATGHIIKMWLKHGEATLVPRNRPWQLLSRRKERDIVGGVGIVKMNKRIMCCPWRWFSDTDAKTKCGSPCKDWMGIMNLMRQICQS